MDSVCEFCKLETTTRGHHVVPKSKGGTNTVPTCETCESFIHHTWSHNELRDIFNTVESIVLSEKYQKFLKWRKKQPATVIFRSDNGRFRDKHKYH